MPRKAQDALPVSRLIDLKTGGMGEGTGIPVPCRRMRFFRQQRGLEQKQLGEMIGASANTVNNWEKGRSSPDISFLPAITRALGITLDDLYGIQTPGKARTEKEQKHLAMFQKLDAGNQYAVERMMKALLLVQKGREQQEKRPIVELPLVCRPLAAGVGDPTEFDEVTEPIYLYEGNPRADCVFRVNGDSMEPEYPDGCYVLVETKGAPLHFGEIGAFSTGNELYIKQYEEDGLHSLNPTYGVIRFEQEDACYLIGRVLEKVQELPTREETLLYQAVKES